MRHGPRLGAIAEPGDAGLTGAAHAAVERAAGLHAVPDDPAIAMLARRSEKVDRALEAVEGVALPVQDHVEGLVVLVAAALAPRHDLSSPRARRVKTALG